MTALSTRPAPQHDGWRQVTHWHRPLMLCAGAMATMTVVSAGGLALDHRMLGGAPIWLKPLHFGVSFTLYAFTLAWMLSRQTRARRAGWLVGTGIAVAATAEMAMIVFQVVRGRASHFNISTPLDSAIFDWMGVIAGVVWLATFALAALLAWQPTEDRALRWAIRFGLVSALVGMALAFLMLANVSPAEVAAMHAGAPTAVGGHSVGVPDGGPGMPVTGWSTTGGDLRIPHFVGLHGLQALPLLGLLLTGLRGRFTVLRDERVRTRLLSVAAVGYAGLIGLVTWQAERGQSLIHPDLLTVTAAVALVAVVAAGATAVVRGRVRSS
jgi:hypothetical protein